MRSRGELGKLTGMSMPPPPLPPRVVMPVDYQGSRRCLGCGGGPLSEPSFTFWGGVIGHKILGIERCESCKRWWVKKTGQPGGTRVVIYTISGVIIGLVLAALYAISRAR